MSAFLPVPVLVAAASSMLGGTAVVATRMLVGVSDATTVALLRCAGSALAIGFYVFVVRRARFSARETLVFAALGVLMFGVFNLLFSAGLSYVPAARGAVVMSTMPIIALLIAAAAGRERITRAKLAGGLLAVVGVVVALGDRASAGAEAWRGDVLMALSAFVGAAHAVLSGVVLARRPALQVLAVQVMAGAAVLAAMLAARGELDHVVAFEGAQWLTVFWLTFVAGLFSYLLWFWALERAPASSVTITVTLNPLTAAVFGAAFLGEPVTLQLAIGLAAVASGIVLAARRTAR